MIRKVFQVFCLFSKFLFTKVSASCGSFESDRLLKMYIVLVSSKVVKLLLDEKK